VLWHEQYKPLYPKRWQYQAQDELSANETPQEHGIEASGPVRQDPATATLYKKNIAEKKDSRIRLRGEVSGIVYQETWARP
jgi:hypothetical protein